MNIFATDKPIVGVRLEGTLCTADENREPNVENLKRLEALRDAGMFVVILTPLAHSEAGTRLAWDFLIRHSVAYDHLWCEPGFPAVDFFYDNEAQQL